MVDWVTDAQICEVFLKIQVPECEVNSDPLGQILGGWILEALLIEKNRQTSKQMSAKSF